MRKIVFLLSILFVSCEDVIKVDLPKAPELVVIDAELSRPQGGGAAQLRVLVTKTTDYYSADIITVNNASVSCCSIIRSCLPITKRVVNI